MTSRLRFRLVLAAGLTAAVLGTGLLPAVAGAGPSCGIAWGSLPKSASPMTGAPLTGVRTGHHDCYDRLVVDVAGHPAAGYDVRSFGRGVRARLPFRVFQLGGPGDGSRLVVDVAHRW